MKFFPFVSQKQHFYLFVHYLFTFFLINFCNCSLNINVSVKNASSTNHSHIIEPKDDDCNIPDCSRFFPFFQIITVSLKTIIIHFECISGIKHKYKYNKNPQIKWFIYTKSLKMFNSLLMFLNEVPCPVNFLSPEA